MIACDLIMPDSSDIESLPPNINRYLSRIIDMDVVCNKDLAYVYTKMGRIILVGFIEYPLSKHWEGTKVHVKKGTLTKDKYSLPNEFWHYIQGKARRLHGVESSISAKQKENIDNDYGNKEQKAIDSETVKATIQDIKLFGKDRVFKEE